MSAPPRSSHDVFATADDERAEDGGGGLVAGSGSGSNGSSSSRGSGSSSHRPFSDSSIARRSRLDAEREADEDARSSSDEEEQHSRLMRGGLGKRRSSGSAQALLGGSGSGNGSGSAFGAAASSSGNHHPHSDDDSAHPAASHGAHPHARAMLIVFTICNLLTYFDRGSVGVCLPTIMQPHVYNLSNFEGGVLAGAYMVGYISASPIFALAVRTYDPFRLIAFGLSIWALAALGCAASIGFVSLLLARAVSGIGEAAFLCIAPPFIDKSIPVGYAFGFVISGHWLNVSLMADYYQWRVIFLAEAVCMLPFIIWCISTETPPHNFKDPPPPRAAAAGSSSRHGDYLDAIGEVLRNRVYMLIILGYAAQTFVFGAVAYFGVRYLMENFGFSVGRAGSYFGGVTVVVGVVGSIAGGWLCDHFRRGKNKAHATAVSMRLAFLLICISFPLCLLSFVKNSATYFFCIFVIAEFILFATASPINSAVIWAVPFRLSPLACSLSIMFIHILGDAISPAIIGALLDATKNNWTLTMVLNCCWLGWSVLFWGWAWREATRKANMVDEWVRARGVGEEGSVDTGGASEADLAEDAALPGDGSEQHSAQQQQQQQAHCPPEAQDAGHQHQHAHLPVAEEFPSLEARVEADLNVHDECGAEQRVEAEHVAAAVVPSDAEHDKAH